MPVRRKPSLSDIERKLIAATSSENQVKAIVTFLCYLGEKCVNRARLNDTYMDQTGNLRSSIGYCVIYNGAIQKLSCQEASKGTDKSTGVREGETFLRDLAREQQKGFALIIVAGMNYAIYVEAKGFDVLTGSRLYAEKQLPVLMRQLKVDD
ncbi:MAG: hypothetical protein LIP01_11780 [Tannerellaceae bacterium]|nr:hypothetical protein [Tannerellaceae bacterium]